jgi:mono/diheme cytochrome c family protein
MECNLCHSVPVVSTSNQLTANLQLNKGFEPPSHQSPNWIGLHNEVFDESCKGCHKFDDPGGVSNTSFCSNSVCHGATWKFAGFDAPKLRTVLIEEAKILKPTPTPTSEPSAAAPAVGSATWDSLSTILNDKCGTCHGEAATKGLNILTYDSLMKGGEDGPVVTAGDPENSMIMQVQSGADAHFGQLSADELALLKQWIQDGAKEK